MENKEIEIIRGIESNEKMVGFKYQPPSYFEKFSMQVHVSGMVGAFLSNQRPWKKIEQNWEKIKTIFMDFEYKPILAKINTDGHEYFVNALKNISCGNRAIDFQMKNLARNINLLLQIERENGSIDAYYRKFSTKDLVKKLTDSKSNSKIIGMGVALLCEYLKGIGIDVAKPDVHIRRILGSRRLGYSQKENAGIYEVFDIMDVFHKNTHKPRAYIDVLLWNYCAKDYGEVCSLKPKCELCKLNNYCQYKNAKNI